MEWHTRNCFYGRVTCDKRFLADVRYRIIIQSEKPPSHLEEKIEMFLDLLRESIVEMPEKEYSANIASLVLSLSETPKFLGKESWRYWSHIDSGFYDFTRRNAPSSINTDPNQEKRISKTLRRSQRQSY